MKKKKGGKNNTKKSNQFFWPSSRGRIDPTSRNSVSLVVFFFFPSVDDFFLNEKEK